MAISKDSQKRRSDIERLTLHDSRCKANSIILILSHFQALVSIAP